MKNLKILLSWYQDFLLKSWNTVEPAFRQEGGETQKGNWLQANWELLVEDHLGDTSIILEPYGDGADFDGASSRVTFPDLLPTHCLIVLQDPQPAYDLLNNQIIDYTLGELRFENFVMMRVDGWHYEEPPFDKILCTQNGQEIVVPFKVARISLRKILK